MRTFLLLCMLTIAFSCSTAKSTSSLSGTVAEDYGYSEKNPIKVGGVGDGPANERKFLDRLSGPNGEQVKYQRQGSCCQFDSKNSPFGMGMLDIYEVEIVGDPVKKKLYLNMYDKDKLHAPKGFILK